MKTTYFLPSALDVNKVGPILELIKLNEQSIKDIKLLICNGALETCSINTKKNKALCFSCKKNIKKVLKSFDFLDEVELESLTNYTVNEIDKNLEFNYDTLADIQQLYWDNNQLDVGWSIVSTFISKKRDISDKIKQGETQILKQNYFDSIKLYHSILNYIDEKSPDEIVIFNGRMFDTRPVLRACAKQNITCKVLEIGGYKLKNWLIFENTLPHNIDAYTKKIEETWNKEKDEDKKIRIGENFFKLRHKGLTTNDKSYTARQNKENLPQNFDPTKKNIVIFNSSEDEIFSIGPEWKKLYSTQDIGIKHICEILKNNNEFQIYLRVHPNLAKVDAPFVHELLNLDSVYDNITVIPPDSETSSYKLLMESDKVVTFGSTMGVEATFWGKPSMSLSTSFYLGINGAYSIKSKDDPFLENFLFDNIQPKPKENAVKYGFFQMNVGEPFKFWKNSYFNAIKIPSPNFLEKITYHAYSRLK